MAKIKIVTDSSAQLTPEEIEEYDIHVIPLSVEINGETTLTAKRLQDRNSSTNCARATFQRPVNRQWDVFGNI